MIGSDLIQVAEKFKRLELHAARGGREVQRALTAVVASSSATTNQSLLNEVRENTIFLLRWLPPYAPPLNNINRILVCLEKAVESGLNVTGAKAEVTRLAEEISNPIQNTGKIADNLTCVLPEKAVIYTHTLSETVLNALLELSRRGKISQVYVTESRPNNDGWDTARRLAENGVPTSLTIDAAMPSVIVEAQLMVSGAEIITANGAVVGKVGAFPAAVFCCMAGKPVWVLAESGKISSFDFQNLNLILFGADELGVKLSSPHMKCAGSYFDVTPQEYIKGYVTELGLFTREEVAQFATGIPVSKWLRNQLITGLLVRKDHLEGEQQ